MDAVVNSILMFLYGNCLGIMILLGIIIVIIINL